MKTKSILEIFCIGILTLTACSKKEGDTSGLNKQQKTINPSELTLKNFKSEPWNQSYSSFFENTKITDNSNYFLTNSELNKNARESSTDFPIEIKFKWAGIGTKGGCTFPIGICIIITLPDKPTPAPETLGSGFVAVNASLLDEKLIIPFPNNVKSNFGLTKDGYLPILKDIPLSINIAGRQSNKTVEAGIYKTNFDASQNRYIGIVLDLK